MKQRKFFAQKTHFIYKTLISHAC